MANDRILSVYKGIFAPCKAKVGQSDITADDVFKCCTPQCKNQSDYCIKICKDLDFHFNEKLHTRNLPKLPTKKSCMNNCNRMWNLCVSGCTGLVPGYGYDNPYFHCAKEHGCPPDLGQYPNRDCVQKNADKIMQCCKSSCIPTSDKDCDEYCSTLASIILSPESLGLPLIRYPAVETPTSSDHNRPESISTGLNETKERADSSKKKHAHIILYVCLGILVGLSVTIASILGILWYRKRN